MVRVISLVFSMCVFATWLYFQGLGVNMMAWGINTQSAYQDVIAEAELRSDDTSATQRPQRKRLTLNEQIRDISGELAYDATHFVRNREVRTEREISMAEMLNDGEAAPSEEHAPLYAMARAPSLMMQDCVPVLEQMATSCRVVKTAVRDLGEGNYILSADLQYLPAYPMGAPADKRGEIVSHSLTMTPDVPPADSPEARQDYIDRAMTLCTALKEKFGNCFIDRIAFSLRRIKPPAGQRRADVDKRLWLNTHTSFSVHGVWAEVNEQTLEAAVLALSAE